MNVPRIVGFVIVITTLMVGIGSNLASMIDPSSLILVVGSVLGMLLLAGTILAGWSPPFSQATPTRPS